MFREWKRQILGAENGEKNVDERRKFNIALLQAGGKRKTPPTKKKGPVQKKKKKKASNAKKMEKTAIDNGSPFTWCENESLEDLSQPERIAQIKADHERKVELQKQKRKINPLRPDQGMVDFDDLYGQQKVCLACHK